MRAIRLTAVAGLATALVLAGCSGSKGEGNASPTPSGASQVELAFTLPAGMTEVSVPPATPIAGTHYAIRLFQGPDECQLRVVRLLLPKSDGSEDEDATYNMLGAIMKSSGVAKFTTGGVALPGTPGPVPALTAKGSAGGLDLRALGRLSNQSLQGFQLVYGCPTGKLPAAGWDALVASVKVDGFTGPLGQH